MPEQMGQAHTTTPENLQHEQTDQTQEAGAATLLNGGSTFDGGRLENKAGSSQAIINRMTNSDSATRQRIVRQISSNRAVQRVVADYHQSQVRPATLQRSPAGTLQRAKAGEAGQSGFTFKFKPKGKVKIEKGVGVQLKEVGIGGEIGVDVSPKATDKQDSKGRAGVSLNYDTEKGSLSPAVTAELEQKVLKEYDFLKAIEPKTKLSFEASTKEVKGSVEFGVSFLKTIPINFKLQTGLDFSKAKKAFTEGQITSFLKELDPIKGVVTIAIDKALAIEGDIKDVHVKIQLAKPSLEFTFVPDYKWMAENIFTQAVGESVMWLAADLAPIAGAGFMLGAGINLDMEKGKREADIRGAAKKIKGAAIAYGNAMFGMSAGAATPEATAAIAQAEKDIASILSRRGISRDDYNAEMKDAGTGRFMELARAYQQAAVAKFESKAHADLLAWRKEHYVLAAFTNEADDWAEVSGWISDSLR